MPPRSRNARPRTSLPGCATSLRVTLGFATGATMKPVYARLVAATRAGEISFGQ